MKIGLNLSIDVTKLDKSRFFKGKKGTYMAMAEHVRRAIDDYLKKLKKED
jgi:hypothetical protein